MKRMGIPVSSSELENALMPSLTHRFHIYMLLHVPKAIGENNIILRADGENIAAVMHHAAIFAMLRRTTHIQTGCYYYICRGVPAD